MGILSLKMRTALFVLAIVASASAFCPNKFDVIKTCGMIVGKKVITCASSSSFDPAKTLACAVSGADPNGPCSTALKKCVGMGRRLKKHKHKKHHKKAKKAKKAKAAKPAAKPAATSTATATAKPAATSTATKARRMFCPNKMDVMKTCGMIMGKKVITCASSSGFDPAKTLACSISGADPNGPCSTALKKCVGMGRRLGKHKKRKLFCSNASSLPGICGPIVGKKVLTCAPKALLGAASALSCLMSGINPSGPCSAALKTCAGMGRRLKKRKMFCPNKFDVIKTCGMIMGKKVITCASSSGFDPAKTLACSVSGADPNGPCSTALKKCVGMGRRLKKKKAKKAKKM